MSKEALTIENLDAGQFVAQVNDAIAKANKLLDATENPKGKAELTIKIVIENADSSGDFRTVTPHLAMKLPAEPKKPSLYPVQTVNGQRTIVVDSEQVGDQMVMPGVADLGAKRAANG